VITSKEIESRQATDVLTLLRDVAGINVAQSGSRGGLTELYPRGGESNFTQVLIDGVQVNEPVGGYD
jgi:outer membrane cobalamin receptor